jgi:thiol-disulfide isomerase/thioredoxin
MSTGRIVAATLVVGIAGVGAYIAGEKYLNPAPPKVIPKTSLIPQPLQPVESLPEFTLTDLDGQPQPISRWAGKVLVLNFWATWCPPCLEEMPGFVELQDELGEKGIQFVGIAIDNPDSVREFLGSNPINYPILLGDENTISLSVALGNRFQGLPFSAIFDRSGTVVYTRAGTLDQDTIREQTATLLNSTGD